MYFQSDKHYLVSFAAVIVYAIVNTATTQLGSDVKIVKLLALFISIIGLCLCSTIIIFLHFLPLHIFLYRFVEMLATHTFHTLSLIG